MSTWLVSYDITDPKRLRRIGRGCRQLGLRLQRSVIMTDDAELLQKLQELLQALVDPDEDDVRCYRPLPVSRWRNLGMDNIPDPQRPWVLG